MQMPEPVTLTIRRMPSTERGCFGLFALGGVTGTLFVGYTVERPWKNNRPYESCIPDGTYKLRPRHYNRGGYDTYEVVDVPKRTHILIHAANTHYDVEGCIGVGDVLGVSNGEWAVLHSRRTLTRLLAELDAAREEGRELILKITSRQEKRHIP